METTVAEVKSLCLKWNFCLEGYLPILLTFSSVKELEPTRSKIGSTKQEGSGEREEVAAVSAAIIFISSFYPQQSFHILNVHEM